MSEGGLRIADLTPADEWRRSRIDWRAEPPRPFEKDSRGCGTQMHYSPARKFIIRRRTSVLSFLVMSDPGPAFHIGCRSKIAMT